jgi:two-component system cell cycle sensor histidine kinase/response regulator CckA
MESFPRRDVAGTPTLSGLPALELLTTLQRGSPFLLVEPSSGKEDVRAATLGAVKDRAPSRRAAEARIKDMIESAMAGIWFSAPEGKTSFMNERMAQILGLSPEEAAHARVTDFVVDADQASVAERRGLRMAGISSSYEHKFLRKDRSVGWGIFESSPLFDAAGGFEGVLTVMRDVTDQRASQEAAREAELRFRRIFESGISGIAVATMSGVITEANDTYLQMLGYTRADVYAGAVNWIAISPVESPASDLAALDRLRAEGVARPFEKEYVRKDGTRISVLVGAALLDHSRVLTVVTDLTAQKKAALANVVLEEQLRQSQKMDAVGRLAGGVAHDFNNLLSVVLSYSEMILADLKEGDPLRADIQEIKLAGERAAALTRQLLVFSRQQAVETKVLVLNDVLEGMDRMLQRLVGEDVTLTCALGATLGRVRVDPGSLEQVIMNLVINARDAMPTGGKLTMETMNVSLDDEYVKSHHGAAPGSYVMLSVTDTGTGMDKPTLARIFEPFFTTKGLGKGTGLGLSTVFGIVQQAGGSVWVYSEPGLGTTFKVYLPRADVAPAELPKTREPTPVYGGETILLVEDDAQVRSVARGILRRHGYTVLESPSVGEAILLCTEHAGVIHLLLSDIVMPVMSGPALAKRLVAARPEMKVLFMSGYTDDAAVRHGVIDAAFAYLQKPLTVGTLTKKVRQVLES